MPGKVDGDELKWFSKIDKKWDSYIKDMLRRAGFR
ncbi:MAG: hypothetical protein G01um101470_808 [Parcubacteria group bacterium Gr01-1014_70]|nr:MAG: hypothetical protein G01um101470_808 [Parcubacteria group bacterium Gr01-1014_70]